MVSVPPGVNLPQVENHWLGLRIGFRVEVLGSTFRFRFEFWVWVKVLG